MEIKLSSLFPYPDCIEKCPNYSLALRKTENETIQRPVSDSGLRGQDTLLPELPLQHPIDGQFLQVPKDRIEHGIDFVNVGQSSVDQRSSHPQMAIRTLVKCQPQEIQPSSDATWCHKEPTEKLCKTSAQHNLNGQQYGMTEDETSALREPEQSRCLNSTQTAHEQDVPLSPMEDLPVSVLTDSVDKSNYRLGIGDWALEENELQPRLPLTDSLHADLYALFEDGRHGDWTECPSGSNGSSSRQLARRSSASSGRGRKGGGVRKPKRSLGGAGGDDGPNDEDDNPDDWTEKYCTKDSAKK
jgi:hypothetical protein